MFIKHKKKQKRVEIDKILKTIKAGQKN